MQVESPTVLLGFPQMHQSQVLNLLGNFHFLLWKGCTHTSVPHMINQRVIKVGSPTPSHHIPQCYIAMFLAHLQGL